MKERFISLFSTYFLNLLIVHFCVALAAQGNALFSDDFSDNHNNWIVNGKKVSISKETGYFIDNTSKENFISLQTIASHPDKDFHISMTIKSEWMDDYDSKYVIGEFGPGFRNCGVFFGASDEKNGYSVALTNKGVLKITKWTNGLPQQLAYKSDATEGSMFSDHTFDIISENGRWKILNVNIPAQPFMGNKIGVYVEAKEKWQFRKLEYYEKDKTPGFHTLVFPTDDFIQRMSEIMCEANDKYVNVVGEPIENRDNIYRYKKTVPGFPKTGIYTRMTDEIKLSELGLDKYVELIGESTPFDNADAALDYFDEAKKAINKSKSDCSIPTEMNNDIARKGFSEEGFVDYQFWANIPYNPASVLLTVTPVGGTDGIHDRYYIVEFHCVMAYN
ncbi:MAG: hypothetical protein IPP15_06095 [Saprospiraceae bacterium]|uniref:Uncharacterized protein n=1 Tax=Candidatus Opimibacter skivensis TaxID=2982028 RepID=A0A9D7XSR8_9BACT|nr:hypothetical protein [Candidatus Opimibacter skivensis]